MKTSHMVVGLLAVAAGPRFAEAGLYNPAEPVQSQLPQLKMSRVNDFPAAFNNFNEYALEPLKSLGMPEVKVGNPLRLRYLLMTDSAREAFALRSWPVRKQLSLSEYLIRRKDYLQAQRLLVNLDGEKPSFLIQANLGTAHQLLGELPEAARALQRALAAWPADWSELDAQSRAELKEMRWDQSDYLWYRRAEDYHRKLVELRSKEKAQKKPNREEDENVDAIFDDAFVFDEKHPFTAGKLPEGKSAPKDAVKIMQQLLVWLPDDRRLLWLLGEAYNAKGDVDSAKEVLRSLSDFAVKSRYRPSLLVDHRDKLETYKPPPPPPIVPPPWVFDWRSLAIGFGIGMVFALIGYWQVREIVRRTRGARQSP